MKIRLLLMMALIFVVQAEAAVVSVDADKIVVERPNSLVDANIEDLNFQLYGGLYSQLLHGECFEEHVDPTEALGLTGSARLAVWVVPDAQGRLVLRQFTGRLGLMDNPPPAPAPAGKKKGKKSQGESPGCGRAGRVEVCQWHAAACRSPRRARPQAARTGQRPGAGQPSLAQGPGGKRHGSVHAGAPGGVHR